MGNDYTAHLDGRSSAMASAKDAQAAVISKSSTATVERMRAMGIEPGRLDGLSHEAKEAKHNRSHNNRRMRLPKWIGPNKPHHRRWAAIAPPAPTE